MNIIYISVTQKSKIPSEDKLHLLIATKERIQTHYITIFGNDHEGVGNSEK
jgi:hypothetical protein